MSPPFSGLAFLVVGHICRDLTPGGERLGGCAAYAALTAHRLGATVRVVTAAGPDLALDDTFDGIDVRCAPSERTTTFCNIYSDNRRRQVLLAQATPIQDIPPEWRKGTVVLLGPIAQEVPPDLIKLFSDSLVAVAPQGWMRKWDERGNVRQCPWRDAESVLRRSDAAILSAHDMGDDSQLLAQYARWARLLAVTQGPAGATVHCRGQRVHCPAWPAVEADPTGAGDVFAAAFLLHLARRGDPRTAADFANCVASFAVERPGLAGVPSWEEVRERWRRGGESLPI
ncbi:MAG: PfkB family carbohydrate kinase [Bacteroidetes bacterium]|nr:PfkB family carbohydrate kinase [Bacteroidota bacterium]MCL5026277.1 PfkB family carbohydrate kinase [Chloroflexota bacterium]